MLGWTVVLTVDFIVRVAEDVMPNFDATLLGLMGISGGTYIGFKFRKSRDNRAQGLLRSKSSPGTG